MLRKYGGGQDTTQQEADEAECPHQVDGGGVSLQVVGQVWLHWSRDCLYHTVTKLCITTSHITSIFLINL